jgi:hypothetical protein
LLRSRFVPIAVDQHVHRNLKDEEGKWFAKVLRQANRGLEGRSQGVYLFSPDGKLLAFSNTSDARSVQRLLATALERFDGTAEVELPVVSSSTKQYWHEPPEGGLVVSVATKVLAGYEAAESSRARAYRDSLGEDHLWVRRDEAQWLVAGEMPDSLIRRIARYHLIDNTRGEPPMWRESEVRRLDVVLSGGRITGSVHLETASGDRGYQADLYGEVDVTDGRVSRFDLVAKGQYWGHGTFTRFAAPSGRFPVAVAFRLEDVDCAADRILPGGARGNLAAYLK